MLFLLDEIKTKKDVRNFIMGLIVRDKFYDFTGHDPKDIVNLSTNEKTFNDTQCDLLRYRTDEVMKLNPNYPDECPLEFALDLLNLISKHS